MELLPQPTCRILNQPKPMIDPGTAPNRIARGAQGRDNLLILRGVAIEPNRSGLCTGDDDGAGGVGRNPRAGRGGRYRWCGRSAGCRERDGSHGRGRRRGRRAGFRARVARAQIDVIMGPGVIVLFGHLTRKHRA